MNQKDHNLVVCETRFNTLSFVLTVLAESMRYGAKKIALPGVFPVFGTLPRENQGPTTIGFRAEGYGYRGEGVGSRV